MNWAQDEIHCSRTASFTGISDAEEYKALLGTALDQAKLIKVKANHPHTTSNESDPCKFKDERTWTEWKMKFENYLSTTLGVNGVPLSYAVWSQTAPDCTTDLQGYFIAEMIACAPLIITHFKSDTKTVHEILKNYLVVEMAEQWINSIENCVNGRDDFDAFCRHYSGEGNVNHSASTADCLQETFHYKSEREFSFNTFLDRMHKMFNIFCDKGEQMDDSTQVREIFRRV